MGRPASSTRTRVDVQADYSYEWDKVQLKAGAVARIYHDDPGNKARDTYEVYVQAAAPDMPFYPSITIYYDFGMIDGLYASLAAGQTWEIRGGMDIVLDARVGVATEGFNQRFFGDESLRGGLVDVSGSLCLRIAYREFFITPKVEYVTLVDSALRDAAEAAGRSPDGVIGGISVAWSF